MVNTYDKIFNAALSLPPGLRAMLVEHLFKSLDAENQLKIDTL
ncbi:MAG: addiction module protein [Nostoc sp.]